MEQSGVKIDDLKGSINNILAFLTTYLPLANAHLSEFITEQQWERLIPEDIRQELTALTDEELKILPISGNSGGSLELGAKRELGIVKHEIALETEADKTDTAYITKVNSPAKANTFKEDGYINIENENELGLDTSYSDTGEVHSKTNSEKCVTENFKTQLIVKPEQSYNESMLTEICDLKLYKIVNWKHSSLQNFCNDARSNTIDGHGLAVTVEELFDQLGIAENDKDLFVSSFMNEKKSHEVNRMSDVCAQLSKYTGCKLVVDIGSGKGYLGQTLCLQYKMTVLGIDALSSNTSAADMRLGIMGKQWEGLTRNLQNQQNGVKLTKKQKKQLKSKEKSQKVTGEANSVEKKMDDAKTDTNTGNTAAEKLLGCPEIHDLDKVSYSLENDELGCYIPITMYVDTETDLKALAIEMFPFLTGNKDNVDSKLSDNLVGFNQTSVVFNKRNSNRDGIQIPGCKNVSEKSSNVSKKHIDTEFEKWHVCPSSSSHKFSCPVQRSEHVNDSIVSDKKHETRDTNDTCLMLTGLHTCGDLASSVLELFVANNDVKSVCSVGCCYHLLTERFLQETAKPDRDEVQFGFPQSSFLWEKRVCLGNTARNLASQSVHRMAHSDELQGCRFYPRALLQKMIEDLVDPESVKWTGLRKLEQRSSCVGDYIRKAWKKLSLPGDVVPEELIQEYVEQYKQKKRQLGAFFQLKAVLAPCVESLILLDRVCFLLEQDNVKDVYLVRMFDPYVSPRCCGIVATKR